MYGKKKMMKKGGKSNFGMLSVKAGIDNNPNPTQADRIAGATKGKKKMMKEGGKLKDVKSRNDYVPQTQREKGNDYFPQSRRKGEFPSMTKGKEGTTNTKEMRAKLEGSAKNFAAIADRARKAKKPR